jgi:micrococcal nuclease
LRGERFKTQVILSAVVVLCVLTVQLVQGDWSRTRASNTVMQRAATARVVRVLDGDTVQLEGMKKSTRLIGVDTPESSKNSKAKSDAMRSGQDLATIIAQGKRAHAFTREYVEGRTVWLESDVRATDRYGRSLLYLFVEDQGGSYKCGLINCQMVNLEIATSGFADVMTIPPNVRYAPLFVEAVREARAAKRGLWR